MTEHASAVTSRAEVRKHIEDALDAAQPAAARAESWGQRMDAAQFAQLAAAAREATERRRRARAAKDVDPGRRQVTGG